MTALIIIVSIVAALLLIAAISSKEMKIKQSLVINTSSQEIFDYIKYVKNHDNFSVWAMMDPDMKKEYRGTDGQVGFVFAWDSNKKSSVGTGEQEIKKLVPNELVEHELRFIKPQQGVSQAIFTLEPVSNNQTKVNWAFDSTMKFPFNLMKPMFSKVLSKSIITGLNNLKSLLEK